MDKSDATPLKAFSGWIIRKRVAVLLGFAIATVFFAFGIPRVQIRTIFSDLLPKDDSFVQVFKDHPNFGSPLTVLIELKCKRGDIYNSATLKKVWGLTREVDLAPAVDHDQVLSITTEKARYSESTPYGIDMRPLMGDEPPVMAEEIAAFKSRVDRAPNVRGFLISPDGRSTLILATFIESRIDYGETFKYINHLALEAQDEDHDILVAGQPQLIGWVYQYEGQMASIALVTLSILITALIVSRRDVVGVLTPIVTSTTAAIWAFGFVGWLKVTIEPLLMIVPLLLTARSFSHSIQFTERFYEIFAETGDKIRAAEHTLRVMMVPSVLGILTDVFGIVVVAAAPIPAMVRHAIFCGMWAVWLIPTGCGLISVLLATLPAPHAIPATKSRSSGGRFSGYQRAALSLVAALTQGRAAPWTTAIFVVLATLTLYTASLIKIGNPVEGSNLFWPEAPYNQAVRAINRGFPGVNTLEIILEAKDQSRPDWTSQRLDTIATEQRLQRIVEASNLPPRATLSFADYLMEANRLFNGGNAKWTPLDPREKAVAAAAVGAMMGASAKNFGFVVDSGMQNSTVSLWYPDNKQETVDAAIASASDAVAEVGADHGEFRVRLASGTIALQEAVNRVIKRYQWTVQLMVNACVFGLCSIAYRSITAGIILVIPVNLANEALIAAMHLLGVGLDVNSMIVAAIGIGVGIDYGIYLLSRICEELAISNGDWGAALASAQKTTGSAIVFTASIMALGIVPWALISDLKFVADMGVLLIAIMVINMVLALVVLPLLLWWTRPAFALAQHQRNKCGLRTVATFKALATAAAIEPEKL